MHRVTSLQKIVQSQEKEVDKIKKQIKDNFEYNQNPPMNHKPYKDIKESFRRRRSQQNSLKQIKGYDEYHLESTFEKPHKTMDSIP